MTYNVFGGTLNLAQSINYFTFTIWGGCITAQHWGLQWSQCTRVLVVIFVLHSVLPWRLLIYYLLQLASGCDASALKDLPTPNGYKFLCQVSSDADGHFVFGSVPCGQYLLVRWTVSCCLKCKFGSPESICDLMAPAASVGGPYHSIMVPLWVEDPAAQLGDSYHSIMVPLWVEDPAAQSGAPITRSWSHYNLFMKLCNAYDTTEILN